MSYKFFFIIITSIIIGSLMFFTSSTGIFAASHLPPPIQDDVTVTASVDREPPIINITNPNDGDTVSGTVAVTADASDDGGITKVEFYVDGFLRITDVSAPYTFSWNTTNEANSSYSIRATAYDIINNTATDTITVTINNVAPVPVGPTSEPPSDGPKIAIPTPFRTILIDLPDIILIGPGVAVQKDFIFGFIIATQIALILLLLFLIFKRQKKKNKENEDKNNKPIPPLDKQIA